MRFDSNQCSNQLFTMLPTRGENLSLRKPTTKIFTSIVAPRSSERMKIHSVQLSKEKNRKKINPVQRKEKKKTFGAIERAQNERETRGEKNASQGLGNGMRAIGGETMRRTIPSKKKQEWREAHVQRRCFPFSFFACCSFCPLLCLNDFGTRTRESNPIRCCRIVVTRKRKKKVDRGRIREVEQTREGNGRNLFEKKRKSTVAEAE